MSSGSFIQERLDALHKIDESIVNLIENISVLFDTYMEPSLQNDVDMAESRERYQSQVKQVYRTLSGLAIGLRKEVKIMDDNIGVYDRNNDLVMILPISIDQKNTSLGAKKLQEELKKL